MQDCRGCFLTRDKSELAYLLRDRCLQMLQQGIVKEYLAFKDRFQSSDNLFKGELILPIGYKQIDKLVQDFSFYIKESPRNMYSSQCGTLL